MVEAAPQAEQPPAALPPVTLPLEPNGVVTTAPPAVLASQGSIGKWPPVLDLAFETVPVVRSLNADALQQILQRLVGRIDDQVRPANNGVLNWHFLPI